MRIVSIQENQKIKKRIAITPEIAKKYLSLGFEVVLSENYADHLGIDDNEFTKISVSSFEIFTPNSLYFSSLSPR